MAKVDPVKTGCALTRAAARTIVFREPRGYSLYKRPDDFLPIRKEAFQRVAKHLNSRRTLDNAGKDRKAKTRGSRRVVRAGDVQKTLIALMTEPGDYREMRDLAELIQEMFRRKVTDMAQAEGLNREEASNCEAFVSETGATIGHDFADLKVRLRSGHYSSVTVLSGLLDRLAGMPNEIGYYVYFLWTGENWQEAPWRLRFTDPDTWKSWEILLQKVFYSALETAFAKWLDGKPERWRRLLPQRKGSAD